MLQSLHVKNLALIDEAEVEFQPGLNIMTGETGAGKSIILGSIHLALGGRYTADTLRAGAEYGYVELVFDVDDRQSRKLRELDIYPEDGMIFLSRRLMEKKSVCKINGETASATKLRQAAEILIDIYGQHEHQTLLSKKNHLSILDDFAKEEIAPVKARVAEEYQEYREKKKELEEAQKNERDRQKEMDFLQFEIQEIQKANLIVGEDEELEQQYRRMVNGKKIIEHAQEAYGYTGDAPGNASDSFSRAIRLMQGITDCDAQAGELCAQLEEIDSLLNDFNRELADYCKSFDFSEEEFYATENRLNEINHMKAKYGDSIEAILAYCEEQEEKLAKLSDYDGYLAGLRLACEEAETTLKKDTEILTGLRKKYAVRLSEAVRQGLLELNFLDVKFETEIQELEDYTKNGKEEAQFMISMNPGTPLRPLVEIASGGELSRIMLAIKAVMADRDETATLIFDEIDTGISGRTAQKVSEKMAVIGRGHQVLCITHLAQIAAMADAHYLIEKQVEDGNTRTHMRLLDEQESVQELARMLGGAEITEAVLKNAEEMRQLAKRVKLA